MTDFPRVTEAQLEDNIESVEYVTHVTKTGQVLRWAILNTRSGFSVQGRASASVCKENDDEVIGKRIAFENAKGELWALMGYALKEKLYEESRKADKP